MELRSSTKAQRPCQTDGRGQRWPPEGAAREERAFEGSQMFADLKRGRKQPQEQQRKELKQRRAALI